MTLLLPPTTTHTTPAPIHTQPQSQTLVSVKWHVWGCGPHPDPLGHGKVSLPHCLWVGGSGEQQRQGEGLGVTWAGRSKQELGQGKEEGEEGGGLGKRNSRADKKVYLNARGYLTTRAGISACGLIISTLYLACVFIRTQWCVVSIVKMFEWMVHEK